MRGTASPQTPFYPHSVVMHRGKCNFTSIGKLYTHTHTHTHISAFWKSVCFWHFISCWNL